MDEELLNKLCSNLDNRGGVARAHPTPELFALLEELFSEEEAQIASMMPVAAASLQELAGITGSPSEAIYPHVESMADKGIVVTRKKDGATLYKLLPLAPGMFEFQFMRGGNTDRDRRLAKLFRKLLDATYNQPKEFIAPKDSTPAMRVIPIEDSIEVGQVVHTFEQISQYIEAADAIAVGHCYCHHEAYLLGEATCDAPEFRCMSFGPGAVYTAERGIARLITKDEAHRIVRECADKGLVHISSNTSKYLDYVCNCCSCHCGALKNIRKTGQGGWLASSGYLARVDSELCTECGTCSDICPVDAVSLKQVKETVAVDSLRCIGCGVCAYHCPVDAISMTARENYTQPPGTAKDLREAMINDFMRTQTKQQ